MKGSKPRIVVVGSLVTDMVFRVGHRPQPGETLLGQAFNMYLGGKGFNQAVCASRLGAQVTLVGRVGRDKFGDMFISKLHDEGQTIIIVTHSYAFNESMLVRVRSMCDAHLSLTIEQLGDKLLKSMEVSKIRGATRTTGNIVAFEVEPGYGMRIIPVSKAKA